MQTQTQSQCRAVPPPEAEVISRLVAETLREDLGNGDLTARLIDPTAVASARLVCREAAVLCGAAWFESAFRLMAQTGGGDVQVNWHHRDGDLLAKGGVVCAIRARARVLLGAERSAINLLQTLSGTATTVREYVAAAGGGARIIDTRKTLPGLRRAQKYAVAVGGGDNHRVGLYDGVLIKENHIAAAGSIASAVARAREMTAGGEIEVEVENEAQLREALDAGVVRILLDNFDLPALRGAVALAGGRARLEASGNVSLRTVRDVARTGVDYISIGALTKHLRAVDFSLRFDDE